MKKAAAYHEAGHALVAYRFGLGVGQISIVPKNGIAGISWSEREWADGSRDIEQIIVLYSGFAAEIKYDPKADRLGSSSDDEKAADLLKCTNESEPSLRQKAKEIVDENWPIIEKIAEKLFIYKTLEADEWSIIIDAFDEGEDPEEMFHKMRQILKSD